MEDPRWRDFLVHVVLYIITMIILSISMRFLGYLGLILMWTVGLGWGAVLAYRLSQFVSDAESGVRPEMNRLQTYLEQARSYQAKIEQTLQKTDAESQYNRDTLSEQIESWIEALEELAHRLGPLQEDELIEHDIEAVPQAIANLEARLTAATDPVIQRQLEQALANRKKQLASLHQLQTTIQRAEIQIESTLSLLGTIYSQLLTGQSTNQVADYSHLSEDINEEVRRLEDYTEALREVRLGEDK